MRFSERHGYKTVREVIQIDSINEDLRNGLWSLLKLNFWDLADSDSSTYIHLSNTPFLKALCEELWFNYFKQPLDTISKNWVTALALLRSYFYQCTWYEVYDFVEFIAQTRCPMQERFIDSCNVLLEKEGSAYRFVNGLISPITAQEEVAEIELALDRAQGPVRTHLRRALELLSNRQSPDYRNSIKESISAIESLVSRTLGKKGTLGELVKKLEDEIGLHPALSAAFSKLYGYTSDEDGIRHAILESADIRFGDAKFFLVACSAFANYVESKVAALS